MRKISLEHVLQPCRAAEYSEQYAYVMGKLAAGELKAIKSGGTNGRRPALPLKFWVVEEQDFSALEDELLYHTAKEISLDYYLKHLDVYAQERQAVRQLNDYFRDRAAELQESISLNERSYAIWHQEKFLGQKGGMTVLKHCGIEPDRLNYYATSEPFACYTRHREPAQTILIIENKDTFYSMRQLLLEGRPSILGQEIGTLVYGGGKRILSCFKDFQLSAEPYLLHPENRFIYFGDLDYEGILIYEQLVQIFRSSSVLKPFVTAYTVMLDKALGVKCAAGSQTAGEEVPEQKGLDQEAHRQRKRAMEAALEKLPLTKDKQNRQIGTRFLASFTDRERALMQAVLQAGRYIPQECLNRQDFIR